MYASFVVCSSLLYIIMYCIVLYCIVLYLYGSTCEGSRCSAVLCCCFWCWHRRVDCRRDETETKMEIDGDGYEDGGMIESDEIRCDVVRRYERERGMRVCWEEKG